MGDERSRHGRRTTWGVENISQLVAKGVKDGARLGTVGVVAGLGMANERVG